MQMIFKDRVAKTPRMKNKNKKQIEKDDVLAELEKEAKRLSQIPEHRPGRQR